MTVILYLLYPWVGAAVGLVMGAMPGLTVTMTVVLIVSLTFGWPMMDSLVRRFCAQAGKRRQISSGILLWERDAGSFSLGA